ncbi:MULTISPECIES: pitrilysin family protein [Acidobacterium]|uniref:Insulinase family protein n=1 Tax=Acidobacterium capsulatum (strain ATCC 51196 / DSM 11244 / BCRC 80197 / JCM 7670 / NBRC 15755 / NCIMB 13165 / 161) TaxID=240015 RepID=C1F812_ACIC5|nr:MULTISPECIES: pitrilysin family protein [Acidobacterium]ACO31498.1 insulinase family protein [Acidobacterium capsulatum ATCC 51196]HCT59291.1 insulinase family protein [Acidobacterium sp.]
MSQQRDIRRTVLPNGLTILTERMEHVRSVAMGVWINTGSRHELPEVNGISHFVEHMVFKGTRNRSAQRIAREVDAIGGNMDAFTGKETICFNMKVLDEHVPTATEVLSDLVLNPVFSHEEITRERGVVLEEIKIDEDNPDYLVHELFVQSFWKDHPLGKPILGTRETVKRFEQDTLFGYYGDRFLGGNMTFSAAGHLEHDAFVEQIRRRFESLPAGRSELSQTPPTTTARIQMRNKKSLEQVQLCLGVPAPHVSSEDRYITLMLNTILGGGMSSRLFQTVREEHGLAYSIYSDLAPYRDTGSLCVYAGTSAANVERMITLVMAELQRMKQEPVTADELRRAKDQLKGNLLLSLESSMSRMSNLARQEMYFGHFFSFDDILTQVEAVTVEQIMQLAQRLFRPELVAVTLLGRLDGVKITRAQLAC